uniref:Retrovirus-related Pol polyprotein from transposon opus n=2 Tax=Lygus hesperus TaxID=30085 RepID=A0A0A9W863_LYGHE
MVSYFPTLLILVLNSVADKFTGTQYNNLVNMTGIGNSKVSCYSQIHSEVIMDNCKLKILFHVLPDCFLRSAIMVGREILSNGYQMTLNANRCTLIETKNTDPKVINECFRKIDEQVSFENITTDITDNKRSQLLTVLNKFAESFTDGLPKTRVTTGQLEIRLIDPTRTVQRRPYRLAPVERETVRKIVDQLQVAGIIRPSCSPFASPVLLVKKKNGSDRMVVDYRELNNNTVPDRFPLPLISDQIARLGGAHFFSCLDMASGFNQIPVHPDSIERTAFVTPDGQWEYVAVPFGLRNGPSVYQRTILNTLGELAHQYVVSYMDDLVIVSTTVEEALERLHKVLTVLTEAGFSLNLQKCSFVMHKIEFLGYEVSAGQIRPNQRKVEALTTLPPPSTVTQLRQFIGLASYFRQFIAKFSEIMAPLYKLTSSKKNIEWLNEHEKIRLYIIEKLTSSFDNI